MYISSSLIFPSEVINARENLKSAYPKKDSDETCETAKARHSKQKSKLKIPGQ